MPVRPVRAPHHEPSTEPSSIVVLDHAALFGGAARTALVGLAPHIGVCIDLSESRTGGGLRTGAVHGGPIRSATGAAEPEPARSPAIAVVGEGATVALALALLRILGTSSPRVFTDREGALQWLRAVTTPRTSAAAVRGARAA